MREMTPKDSIACKRRDKTSINEGGLTRRCSASSRRAFLDQSSELPMANLSQQASSSQRCRPDPREREANRFEVFKTRTIASLPCLQRVDAEIRLMMRA